MPRVLSGNAAGLFRGPLRGVDIITATGTWTKPSDVDEVLVSITGGGPRKDSASAVGCGATIWRRRIRVTGNVSVTIGAGATADEGAGGATSFGSLSAAGGLWNALSGGAQAVQGIREGLVQTSGNDAWVYASPTIGAIMSSPDPSFFEGVEFAGRADSNPGGGLYGGFWSLRSGSGNLPWFGVRYGAGVLGGNGIDGVCVVEYY